MSDPIASLRLAYARATLGNGDVLADPIEQFRAWFEEARAAQLREPNAMTLATAAPDGAPSARIVLLKGIDARGFAFYTDYRSRKAAELEANPRAALVFHWMELERQVRVTGRVGRVTAAESEAYFATRPVGSRIGAWASHQSQVIASRAELERRESEVAARFAEGDVPLPPHWGGYRVVPESVELWQGRPSRLHDRLQYVRDGDGWRIARLSP
jgi:pyridoxamine 5'-phosphate oxidase